MDFIYALFHLPRYNILFLLTRMEDHNKKPTTMEIEISESKAAECRQKLE